MTEIASFECWDPIDNETCFAGEGNKQKVLQNELEMHCEHYDTNCLIKFECCQNMYPCRLCHNKIETHKANRYEINQMMCRTCNTLQPKAQFCTHCTTTISRYFCQKCNLWDNSGDGIFHCEKCNACRRGDPKAILHCDICQTCLMPTGTGEHIHVENTTGGDCPICADDMSETTDTLVLLMCGHSLHETCFNNFLKETHTCPICLKSTGDTSEMNRKIEYLLKTGFESSRGKLTINTIRCQDCSSVSEQKSRFIYNKCPLCSSYNTRVVDHKE